MKLSIKKATLEAIKDGVLELLRLAVIAVIPTLIVWVADLPREYAVIAVMLLKALDEFLHELGKGNKDESLTKGLTRF